MDTVTTADAAALRSAYGRFPSGVTALCALDPDGAPVGMAVSAFVGVSLDPPLVGVYVQHSSTTWPRLRERPRIGLSVLGSDQVEACRRLASRDADRFTGLTWHTTAAGGVLLHGATAWFDCEVEAEIEAGDHMLALLRVHRQQLHPDNAPLVFYASSFHGLERLGQVS